MSAPTSCTRMSTSTSSKPSGNLTLSGCSMHPSPSPMLVEDGVDGEHTSSTSRVDLNERLQNMQNPAPVICGPSRADYASREAIHVINFLFFCPLASFRLRGRRQNSGRYLCDWFLCRRFCGRWIGEETRFCIRNEFEFRSLEIVTILKVSVVSQQIQTVP